MLDVDILYNANEYRIQVDKADKDGFQKMITDTKEALKIQEENKNLKIMTINSKNKFYRKVYYLPSNYGTFTIKF